MRAILINHCHPDTPHVCAVRAREFAGALAARGHRIVLLTETLTPDDAAEDPAVFAVRLAAHDWSAPLRLACRPRGHRILRALREGRLPAAAGKAVVGGYYAALGTVFADWGAGARAYFDVLRDGFAPEIVWSNFGNTECLRIAQGLSRRSGCPWVLDVKDYWTTFIPAPFRAALGRRFGDAAAMTALSEGHVRNIAPFVGESHATVIYSGIPEALCAAAPPAAIDRNRIVIAGATYDRAHLDSLLSGIAAAEGGPFEIDYAGREGEMVRAAADGRAGIARVTDHGFIPLDRLAALQRGALANAFIRSGPGWFQHKVPELLAAGRPIVCIPGPDTETRRMAADAAVPLHDCENAADVADALRRIAAAPDVAPDEAFVAGLTWRHRAMLLEGTLQAACR